MVDEEYVSRYGDPRLDRYPLMGSPLPTYLAVSSYFVFVKIIGPRYMRDKPPFDLRGLMLVYNFLLAIFSTWAFLSFGVYGWFTTYRWRCEPVGLSDDENSLKMVEICYIFYASKLVEFADTIFAVLRKKDSQLSGLHVFHHTVAPLIFWYTTKYGPGGYTTFFMMFNAFVHMWMYFYYALSSIGPWMQKYLWWKKYITTIQLIQFFSVFVHTLQLYLFPPEYCKVSSFLALFILTETTVFFVLFSKFYIDTYSKPKSSEVDKYKRAKKP